MASLINAKRYLEHLQRFDLAGLVDDAQFEIITGEDDVWGYERSELIISARTPFLEALRSLSSYDKKRIAEAICASETDAEFYSFEDFRTRLISPPVDGPSTMLPEALIHAAMMADVATGGKPIQEVNDHYRARQQRLVTMTSNAEIEYKNQFEDLWDWYGYWKEHFAHYSERRQFIRKLFSPTITAITTRSTAIRTLSREPTGWERVDRGMAKARQQLTSARHEEDFQTVGLLCREILISLGQEIYDPQLHTCPDGVAPSKTDAARMLDAFLHYSFSGDSYKEVRSHAKASINLALNLQHRRTATRQLAELCLEATGSTIAVAKILSDKPS